MSRTCSKCRFELDDGQSAFRFCPRCGEPLPTLEPAPVTFLGDDDSRTGRDTGMMPQPLSRGRAPVCTHEGCSGVGASPRRERAKLPALAALLSLLLVGMGQVYLGQVEKGLVILGVVLLLVLTAAPGPLGIVILFLNVLDAFLLARKLNGGERIGKWEFFFQSS